MAKRRGICNNGSSSTTPIKSLPKDLLVEVIARVASNSVADLCNMRMCCKDFLDASEDNYVLQNVTLDKFSLMDWFSDGAAFKFYERCRKSGNIDCLFSKGLCAFFNAPNENISNFEDLKIAAQKGHLVAKYVYGMILLCSHNDDLRKEGLKYMRFLRKSKCVTKCRNVVDRFVSFLWEDNVETLVCNDTHLCRSKNTCKWWRIKKGSWELLKDEDDDISLCEYCRWDHEIECFGQLFGDYIDDDY